MPITISPNQIHIKKEDGSGYLPGNVVAGQTTEQMVAAVQAAGQTTIDHVNQAVADAQSAVNTLDAQKNSIAQTVASMAQLGTDTELSTPGMAADAGAVGNLKSAIKTNVFNLTAADKTEIADGTDLDTITTPGNYVVYTEASSASMVHGPVSNSGYGLVVFCATNASRFFQIAFINSVGDTIMWRNKAGDTWGAWRTVSSLEDLTEIISSVDTVKFLLGDKFVARYTGAFTARQEINTYIILKNGKTYKIVANKPFTGNTLVYGLGADSNYKKLNAWQSVAVLSVSGTDRHLKMFNSGSNLDDIDISVYEVSDRISNLDSVPSVYYVNKTEPELGQYTSLTQCLLDLKDDTSPKIIYIEGGDYDIYQEYIDAGVPVYTGSSPMTEYFDYCVWVPDNTHIIGRGLVRLKWMPTLANNPEITVNQCKTVSPVNTAGSCIIENVEIWCKNGRYCIHDDPLKQEKYNDAIKIFRNIRFYKEPNETDGHGNEYGATSIIGFGAQRSMHTEYQNCYFLNTSSGYAFYGHTENSVGSQTLIESMSSDFVLTDCTFVTVNSVCVSLQNVTNQNLHCRVFFGNCYFGGSIALVSASSQDPTRHNAFDLTLVKSGNPTITIADPNNEYPPKVYN